MDRQADSTELPLHEQQGAGKGRKEPSSMTELVAGLVCEGKSQAVRPQHPLISLKQPARPNSMTQCRVLSGNQPLSCSPAGNQEACVSFLGVNQQRPELSPCVSTTKARAITDRGVQAWVWQRWGCMNHQARTPLPGPLLYNRQYSQKRLGHPCCSPWQS